MADEQHESDVDDASGDEEVAAAGRNIQFPAGYNLRPRHAVRPVLNDELSGDEEESAVEIEMGELQLSSDNDSQDSDSGSDPA